MVAFDSPIGETQRWAYPLLLVLSGVALGVSGLPAPLYGIYESNWHLSPLATTIVFAQLFDRDYGLFNWFLELLGFEHIEFTASVLGSHLAIAAMVAWRWTGYNTLLYLASLQAVPRELYEAAAVDGRLLSEMKFTVGAVGVPATSSVRSAPGRAVGLPAPTGVPLTSTEAAATVVPLISTEAASGPAGTTA